MRVGMLTGGGDCPGLNAVIRAAVRKGIQHHGDEFVGFMEGWRGVLDNVTMPLTLETTSGILQRGGTILRSSRTNVKKVEDGVARCVATLKTNGIDALIAIRTEFPDARIIIYTTFESDEEVRQAGKLNRVGEQTRPQVGTGAGHW